MARAPFFPVFLDLEARPCVVIGGGRIAHDKIGRLVEAGAAVTVIAPRLHADVAALAQRGAVDWQQRNYAPGDLAGAFLVIAATSDGRVNRSVHAEAIARGCLINVVDVPDLCSYITPSIVRRGKLTLAISTQGAAPALAAVMRRYLERLLGNELGDFIDRAALWRRRVNRGLLDPGQRRRQWYKVLGRAAPMLLTGSPRRLRPGLPDDAGSASTPAALAALHGQRGVETLGVAGMDLMHGTVEHLEAIHARMADSRATMESLLAVRTGSGRTVFNAVVVVPGVDRAEIYYQSDFPRLSRRATHACLSTTSGTHAAGAQPALYHYRGVRAIRHLFEVAAGVQGVVPLDGRVRGDLRRGLDLAGLYQALTPLLTRAFRAALAAHVRHGGHRPLAHADPFAASVVDMAAGRIPQFSEARFVIMGDDAWQRIVAARLRARGIPSLRIAMWSPPGTAARNGSETPRAAMHPLEAGQAQHGVILMQGAADNPVLTAPMLRKLFATVAERLWVLDMGIPRIAWHACATLPGVVYWDLDNMVGSAPSAGAGMTSLAGYANEAAAQFLRDLAGQVPGSPSTRIIR